jgi:hypothetical protein
MAVYDDGGGPALYGGGQWTFDVPVMRWDGATFSAAGAGLQPIGFVNALTVFDGSAPGLYAGGEALMQVGANPVHVARLRAGTWEGVGQIGADPVTALAGFDDGSGAALYAGAAQGMNGASPAVHFFKWNGTAWSTPYAVGPAATAAVNAMTVAAAATPSLWVGGSFLSVAGVGSVNVAELRACAPCYANCDGSTAAPVLNIADFVCFQQRFAAGDSYANCDGSTTPPVLNIGDFVCFGQRFAAGCP